MKKSLSPLCLLLLTCIAYSQPRQNLIDPWGTWGIGYIKNANTLNVYEGYNILGYHLYISWDSLEPEKGVFAWDQLDSQLSLIADKDIWIGVQVLVGPNSPLWIYDKVPQVFTTGGNLNGPYPYYLDPEYKRRYYYMMEKFAKHLDKLPDSIKSHLMYWQISEGSTGDEDPYKGTPTEPQYDIDYYTWEDFKHEAWDSVNSYRPADASYRFLFNSGNYAQDIQYVDAKFPKDMHKNGLLSHWYSFDGELLYYIRQYRNLLKLPYSARTRGEVQDNFNKDWWKLAPVKQAFTLACSALSGGLDMMDIGGGYINATLDTRPTDFFRKYAGFRYAISAKKGFIGLRDVPDFLDTARFSEEDYGPVITPGSEQAFQKKINNINNNERDSSMRKYWQKMKAITQFLNPARVTKITEEFAPMGAMYTTDDDDYHNDFGSNMTTNYAKFIRQIDPNKTSIGAWRIGPDTSMYGRYARLFKIERGAGEMYFVFNEALVEPGETVELTVVFYDTANGQWSVHGSNKQVKITNRNSNRWIQRTVGLKNFIPKTLLDGRADFSLRYDGGANTPFALLEVNVVPAEKQPQPDNKAIAAINLKLSPNPNKGEFSVELHSKAKEVFNVIVTNANGNMIFSEKKTATAGVNVWNFTSPNLKEGTYILHVESATAKGSVNFVVNK